jgi:hypothetical protein
MSEQMAEIPVSIPALVQHPFIHTTQQAAESGLLFFGE